MALRFALLALLLIAGGAHAADRQGEVCGDGTYHQSGFCPAVLSSPGSASVGETGASCTSVIDVSDGTNYCCMTSTATPLSAAATANCSGGAAVSGNSAAVTGSGTRTVAVTGLTASTGYYAQSANLSPEQWYSNAVVSSQFTTTTPGGDPYTPQGGIPSGWESRVVWPTAPTLTSGPVSVTPATLAANLVSGRDISLQNGSYGSITIPNGLTDIRISAENPGSATATFLGVHGNRIRVNGLRVNGDIRLIDELGPSTAMPTDVLLDNIHADSTASSGQTVIVGETTERIAIINSTIIQRGNTYTMLSAGGPGTIARNLIIANSALLGLNTDPNPAGTNHPMRVAHQTEMVLFDNWFESYPSIGLQHRVHNEIEDVLCTGNVFIEGAAKLYWGHGQTGEAPTYARRIHLENNTFYQTTRSDGPYPYNTDINESPYTSMGQLYNITEGVVQNNTHYSQARPSGSATSNPGGNPWQTFTNNIQLPYQSPPTRTAGASH